jgi:hypothetical protein
MTLGHRIATVVSLLPSDKKARFLGPLKPGESLDARMAEAVGALAKSEGMTCMTPDELARAVLQKAVEHAISAPAAAEAAKPDGSLSSLAAQFKAITDLRAQTAFWRTLTAEQRAEILKAKQLAGRDAPA